MTEVAPVQEVPPRWVPAMLSFVAGYIDSYTFLALYGLFVAQVTGSFVTAGAQFVVHDVGIAGKIVAIIAFLFAAALTAALIGLARDHRRDAFPWMLGLETLPTNWMMDPCSLLAKFSTCLNMYLPLKHRRGLPIGHGLGTGV